MAIAQLQGPSNIGRDFMESFMAMLSYKQRKDIAEKEVALKKTYYDILGKEAERKGKLAPLEKELTEMRLKSERLKLKEQKRVADVYKANPQLMEEQMRAEAAARGNQQEMGMMRLMLQSSAQQISALGQQLQQTKFIHTQEKDRMNWLFNTFLNPEVAKPIREAIGEDEFEARKGRAMEELTGVDKRVTPVKQGLLGGGLGKLIGDESATSMSFQEALTAWKEGRVDVKRFWGIWKDRLEESGYFRSGDMILRNPSPNQLKEMQKGYKLDLSKEGAMDKVLKEKK